MIINLIIKTSTQESAQWRKCCRDLVSWGQGGWVGRPEEDDDAGSVSWRLTWNLPINMFGKVLWAEGHGHDLACHSLKSPVVAYNI